MEYGILLKGDRGYFLYNSLGKLFFPDRACKSNLSEGIVCFSITKDSDRYGFFNGFMLEDAQKIEDAFNLDLINFNDENIKLLKIGNYDVITRDFSNFFIIYKNSLLNVFNVASRSLNNQLIKLMSKYINKSEIVNLTADYYNMLLKELPVFDRELIFEKFCHVISARERLPKEFGVVSNKLFYVKFSDYDYGYSYYIFTGNEFKSVKEPSRFRKGEDLIKDLKNFFIKYHLTANRSYSYDDSVLHEYSENVFDSKVSLKLLPCDRFSLDTYKKYENELIESQRCVDDFRNNICKSVIKTNDKFIESIRRLSFNMQRFGFLFNEDV